MPENLKTVLFAYSSPTLHHGSPRVLVDMITGLDKNRFRPILICPRQGELTELLARQGVEVVIAKWRSITKTNVLSFVFDLLYFWNLMRVKKVHLLHMNEVGWRDSITLAAWLRRVAVILHLHVNYDGPIQANWNFRLASLVLVVADVLKGVFRNTPQVHNKLMTIHNGLDIEQFEKGQNIRSALGLPANAKVVGYIGQIVEAKGLRVLVAAAKTALNAYPDTVFLFVGRRVSNEAGFADELMQLAATWKIAHALRFMAPRNDIPDVMKSLDILVLPTLGEAFPKVILEGMGAGVSVIASQVGGIPEIIKDGVNGVLVPPNDVQALEMALLRLLGNPELRQKLASEGLRTVRNQFSVQIQSTKICEIYDKLLTHG